MAGHIASVQQPLMQAPLHSMKPDLQAPRAHWLLTQVASALAKLQTFPHIPQLPLSVLTSTHLLSHLVGDAAGQSETQVCFPPPDEQSGVRPLQVVVQVPQWASVVRAVSQSGLAVSQLPNPASQVTGPQVPPARHAAEPWLTAQLFPHAPQLLALVRAVSQPGSAVQSPKPSLHLAIVQTPLTHDASALAKPQLLPQAPQFDGSVCRSTQLVPQTSDVGAAQLATQVRAPLELEQRGVGATQLFVQLPHVSGRPRLVSQPSSPLDVQWAKPSAQPPAGTQQLPARHSTAAPVCTLASAPQS
jgi:hypothetical protein